MAAMCGLLAFFSDAGATRPPTGTRSRRRWSACTTAVRTRPASRSSATDAIFAHKRLAIIDVALSHEPLPYARRAATC